MPSVWKNRLCPVIDDVPVPPGVNVETDVPAANALMLRGRLPQNSVPILQPMKGLTSSSDGPTAAPGATDGWRGRKYIPI